MLTGIDVDLAEIDAVAGVADHVGLVPFEIQGRVYTALLQPDGIRPFSGRVFRGNEEVTFAGDISGDHVEGPLMITYGGGVYTAAAVGILEVQLRLPCKAVAYLLPVDQVFGMIDRNSRKILESAGYQVIIISDPADAGVGIEARDDGIHITKLLRLCSRSNSGHRQQDGDERFVHGMPLFSFLAIACKAFPHAGCESTACERAEDEDPELLQSVTSLEEGGTDGACRIDGSAGVADAGEVYEDEGKTDGEPCEIACALLLIGSAEDDEHEYEGEEHLGQQAADQ